MRSHQTKNVERLIAWRAAVLAAAQARWPIADPPIDEAMKITVVYYHNRPTVRIDNDNLIKPIQDALNGFIYDDDSLITDTHARKTHFDGSFKVRRMSRVLADAFVEGEEFLHIRIDRAPGHEVLM
jgi:Holliday junction resolvase RusA-like endonuclease